LLDRRNAFSLAVVKLLSVVLSILAARRSWVLREVFHGFSEEARTRGFPSPSFGGFGLVIDVC